MEGKNKILSEAEAVEYGEYQRSKREAEVRFTLQKTMVDCSQKEVDKAALFRSFEGAKKLGARGILCSPIHLMRAKKLLQKGEFILSCAVGGTGEGFASVKRAEVKKAVWQGAREVFFTPCYSAILSGNFPYLKRELKKIRRACKKRAFIVRLDDTSLSEEEICLGIRAACAARADGVSVCSHLECVEWAVRASEGKLFVAGVGVENAERLRLLIKAGATRFYSENLPKIAEELCAQLNEKAPL